MSTRFEMIGEASEASGFLLPLLTASVPAGTPEEIIHDSDETVDLNKHLIKNPGDTFIGRAKGDSMVDEKIDAGDLLIVDAAIQPTPGDIVVIAVDDAFTVKRLCVVGKKLWLVPGNANYKARQVRQESCNILGVVTYVIKAVR
jgi:DNA polymerase V